MTGWELAEWQHDVARDLSRSARHLTARERRERRFWPPVFLIFIIGGFVLAGLIENGYIQ